MQIDHVIYATRDLDAAAAHVESELGVAAVAGGRHEGMGTHNCIVPLGRGYIELLAIADPDEAAGSDLGRALLERIGATGDGLLGWAVSVEDVGLVVKRLGVSTTGIARQGMTARLAGLAESMRDPYLPFFIQRDPGVRNPAQSGGDDGIEWIELSGERARLADWLGGADLPIRVVDGPGGVRAIGTARGELRNA